MNTDQIAEDAADKYLILVRQWLGYDVPIAWRKALIIDIKSAIEKALEYDDEKWRERERKFKLIVEKFGYPSAAQTRAHWTAD